MITEFVCIKSRIFLELPYLLFDAQSSDDAGTGVILSRLFHNKPSILASNFFRCYLSYFSPEFIFRFFGLVGLILFFVGVYYIVINRKYILLGALLFAPLCLLFEFPASVPVRTWLLFGGEIVTMMYGLWQLFFALKKIASAKGHKLPQAHP